MTVFQGDKKCDALILTIRFTSKERLQNKLYNLSEFCNYRKLTSEMICDRLVVAIYDGHLSECRQLDSELTSEKAKKAIHQHEPLQGQQNMFKGVTVEPSNSLDRLQAGYDPERNAENP